MAVAFTLQVDDDQILGSLRRMRGVVEDMRPVHADIGAELESSTVKRFVTNVAPDGTPWKASLRAEKTGTPTLVMTSNLRDSIHYVADAAGVSVGSALIYAKIHQTGGVIEAKGGALSFTLYGGAFVTVRSVKIPARPYLGLSANDNRVLPEIIGEHLAVAARGAR